MMPQVLSIIVAMSYVQDFTVYTELIIEARSHMINKLTTYLGLFGESEIYWKEDRFFGVRCRFKSLLFSL